MRKSLINNGRRALLDGVGDQVRRIRAEADAAAGKSVEDGIGQDPDSKGDFYVADVKKYFNNEVSDEWVEAFCNYAAITANGVDEEEL